MLIKYESDAYALALKIRRRLVTMSLSYALRLRWRLLMLAALLGALAVVGLSSQSARAASAAPARPFVGCAPCISQVSPADGSTATIDADGKVTISFSAQLVGNYAKFEFTLDGTAVDATQIQVTDTDPTQPTGQYRATLSAGQHSAFVQVFDANGPAAAIGWKFTVPQPPPPTPTPTKASSGGNNNNSTGSSGGGSGGISPQTLSIILFSIAGVGLLVMVFIAGMWYSGRRSLRNLP
jgi:hypothetical protein